MHLKGIWRPLGEIGDVGGGGHGRAAVLLSLRAGVVGEPAAELIAVPGGIGQRDGGQRPVGEQREGPRGAAQVGDALAVIIDLCAGSAGGPAVEGGRGGGAAGDRLVVDIAVLIVVGNGINAGESVCRQGFRRVVGVGGGSGSAARCAVAVIADSIGNWRPLGKQRFIAGGRIACAAVADLRGASRFAVPAAEGISRAGGRGQRDGGQRPVGVQGHRRAVGGGQIGDALLIVIDLRAGGGGSPAVEGGRGRGAGVAAAGVVVVIRDRVGAGEAVGCQGFRHVISVGR